MRKRVAWGVMGYGRGHATRTLAALPAIAREHEVTVFAGADAFDWLAPRVGPAVEVVRIPGLGYRYGADGRFSAWQTVRGNAAPIADVVFGGRGLAAVAAAMTRRGIEVAISDSEAWTHAAARRLGLPRIGFDHVGVIAYCRYHGPAELWAAGRRDAVGYRALMGTPERILLSSFYPAEPLVPQATVVGPMLRDVVRAARARATTGAHLLAYFNKGTFQYRAHLHRTLSRLDLPVRVYGTPYRGTHGNVVFCAPSETGFVDDLATCRGVLGTAGNQLAGEAIFLEKPILSLPEDAFEQRLNAHVLERMGVGLKASLASVSASDIDRFLGHADSLARATREHARDGGPAAVDYLLRAIPELAAARGGWRPVAVAARPAPAPALAHAFAASAPLAP